MTNLLAAIRSARYSIELAEDAAVRGDDYDAKLLVWGAKKALAPIRCPRAPKRTKTSNPARKGVGSNP